ncbi:hypothetical protein FS749_010476 [Ceratobasidium sp. UAMH 11750]|nr:hypothetical protein FS749_010476 [Ceratobasidium sp. UAMH 11750]
MERQDTIPMKCNDDVFTTYLGLLSTEAAQEGYSAAFVRARQMEKQPGVLERAGRVGDAFKVLLALGSTMSELDPTGGAKVAFSLCTKAWEFLETQEKQDADLNKLVEDIAGILPSVESVKIIADTDLAQTVIAMLNLIEDVSLFIVNFRSRQTLERAFRSVFDSTASEKMEDFVNRFRRLREEFDM